MASGRNEDAALNDHQMCKDIKQQIFLISHVILVTKLTVTPKKNNSDWQQKINVAADFFTQTTEVTAFTNQKRQNNNTHTLWEEQEINITM